MEAGLSLEVGPTVQSHVTEDFRTEPGLVQIRHRHIREGTVSELLHKSKSATADLALSMANGLNLAVGPCVQNRAEKGNRSGIELVQILLLIMVECNVWDPDRKHKSATASLVQ